MAYVIFLDKGTANFEKKVFGDEIPINVPQLLGTLRTEIDIEDIKKLNT